MDKVTRVLGIDPGLIDTGIVSLTFDPGGRTVCVRPTLVSGLDPDEVKAAAFSVSAPRRDAVFVEGYRPRSNFGHDREMIEGVRAIAKATGGKVLDNMGVKKIIKRPLMELLGVYTFKQTSNHQDLRSAARIALLGMAKDDQLNELLADVVRDGVEGRAWSVI